jgi:hypothetical protein
VLVAFFEARAGKGREIAIARTVDEGSRDNRATAGFVLDQQRLDARLTVHDDADRERVKADVDLVRDEEIVGGAFQGRGVVCLGEYLAEHHVRRVQPAELVDARQQIVGDAMHDLFDVAMHIGMQPAEIGDAGRRAHAAEESITFDQQHAPPVHASRSRGCDTGGTAAE